MKYNRPNKKERNKKKRDITVQIERAGILTWRLEKVNWQEKKEKSHS